MNRHNVNDSRDVTVQFGRDPVGQDSRNQPGGQHRRSPDPADHHPADTRAAAGERPDVTGSATMTINWGALGLVAVVDDHRRHRDRRAVLPRRRRADLAQRSRGGSAATLPTVAGYACLAVSGLIAAYGLYLIIPQFH